jgi:hypothetical protein
MEYGGWPVVVFIVIEGSLLMMEERPRIPTLRDIAELSERHLEFIAIVAIIGLGLMVCAIAVFGKLLSMGRGLWRWRLWILLNTVMMLFTLCSPITLALGIPATILWGLPATRDYFDDRPRG